MRYLDIQTCPSRKLHIWNSYRSIFLRWTICCFVYYFGILIGWICENVQLTLVLPIIRHKTIWCFRLEFFSSCLYRDDLLSLLGFLKCDLLYICSIFSSTTLSEKIAVPLRLLLTSCKSTVFCFFDCLGPALKSIFSTYGHNIERSLVRYAYISNLSFLLYLVFNDENRMSIYFFSFDVFGCFFWYIIERVERIGYAAMWIC